MENVDFLKKLDIDVLESILEALPSNIFVKDINGKYVYSSSEKDTKRNVIGKNSLEVNINEEEGKLSYEADKRIIETGRGTSYERVVNINGIKKYLQINKNPVFDKEGNVIAIVGEAVDISSLKELQEKLKDLANRDELTKVYNRTYLSYWIKKWNKEELYPLTVFSVDCNDLKFINDNYGHSAGDEYLVKTAQILTLQASKESIITRMGGDEFLVIYPNCYDKQAIEYYKSIFNMANMTKVYNNPLSFAVGFNTIDNYSKNIDFNIDLADKEMYENKKIMKRNALRK